MSLLAYTIGALASGGPLDMAAFLIGMACMAALKVATVLTNDIYDRASDARNPNWSPFTGGSRSLHEGGLKRDRFRYSRRHLRWLDEERNPGSTKNGSGTLTSGGEWKITVRRSKLRN